MQRLEVSGAVRPIYGSLGVKRLRSSRSCLRLLHSILFPSIFPLVTCFRKKFLRMMWSVELAFLHTAVCRMFLSPWPYVILHVSHDQSNWPSLSSSNSTFQNFRGTSDLLSKVSSVRHHTPVAYPGILFGEGCSTNSVDDRGQRERGSGGGNPLVRGSGGSCNLVQEISFHIVKFFLIFCYFKTIYYDNQFICHC